jgi:2,4-dienoyl-CoA reductase-like NADH-dependent reductase (Old Yellow Enzyme family)/thioredoxin reductase
LFPNLAKPIVVGKMYLKNRMVSQVTMFNAANPDGSATPIDIDEHRRRAAGGWALVNVGAVIIRPDGRNFPAQLGIYKDILMPGLVAIAEAIHEGGAKAGIQLLHAGIIAIPRWSGMPVIAPSSIGEDVTGPAAGLLPKGAICHELTLSEIDEVIEAYAAAAMRAKEAGFDAVMLHGAHGFLIAQFMSPSFNRRNDEYNNPTAFAVKVIKRVREVTGKDYTVGMRVSADEFLGKDGYGLDDFVKWCPEFEAAGLDFLDVSAGTVGSVQWVTQPCYFPRGVIVYLAEAVKKAVKIPVVTVGRINDPILAESVIASGRADLVSFTRQSIADYSFAQKVLDGRPEEIRKCIACDKCLERLSTARVVYCTLNYDVGRLPFEYEIKRAEHPKRVMVIGAGMAGMEAARVATLRGHEVNIYDKEAYVGGAVVNTAANIPRVYTKDLLNGVEWLSRQMVKLGIRVELGKMVTSTMVSEYNPDVVILATGSRPCPFHIPGADGHIVVSMDEFLANPVDGQKFVVLGANYGLELAVSLARQGKNVKVVEPSDKVGCTPYIVDTRRVELLKEARALKIDILTCATVKEIRQGSLVIEREGGEEALETDAIIVALEREPVADLAKELSKVREIYQIGDCEEPSNVMHAMHSANRIARLI